MGILSFYVVEAKELRSTAYHIIVAMLNIITFQVRVDNVLPLLHVYLLPR